MIILYCFKKYSNKKMKNKTNRKKKYNKQTQLFLLKLTSCSSFFLLFLFIGIFLLYLFGNFQNFGDENQIRILYFASVINLGLFLFCVAGFIESLILFFINKFKFIWIYFGIYFFLMILNSVIYIILRTILHLTQGL